MSAMCAPVNYSVLVHARQDSQQGCYDLQAINLIFSTPQMLPSDRQMDSASNAYRARETLSEKESRHRMNLLPGCVLVHAAVIS